MLASVGALAESVRDEVSWGADFGGLRRVPGAGCRVSGCQIGQIDEIGQIDQTSVDLCIYMHRVEWITC